MDIHLVKTYTGFAPANGEDEKIKRYKIGDTVKAKITVPRNVGFHRKFFAMMNLVYQNQGIFSDFENFREQVTIEAGYFTWAKDIKNNSFKRAKSISFAQMDQAEFEKFYSDTINVCFMLLKCNTLEDQERLEKEVVNFI